MTFLVELELETTPTDGIACLAWSTVDQKNLLVGSWDSSLRLYDTDANKQLAKFDHKAAVLGACFSPDGRSVFSGGLDTWLRMWDLQQEEFRVLSTHSRPISSLIYSQVTNNIITGSWDATLAVHDPRSATPKVASYDLPERVYHMDSVGNTLVVAMGGRKINIYDVRKMEKPTQERESSLRFMTRALACMPSGEGFAIASIEGRVAVEYFDMSPAVQAKKYAFKCHRQTIDGNDHVWPVNSLAFHPIHHTFASAGSDGLVSIWDHTAKKRLRQYPQYHNAVNAISFNAAGSKLAIGVSYGWDKGQEGARAPENGRVSIFVRQVTDKEVMPKSKA
ncbi:Mitotic checkpoint protein BUB3.2 AltName: Full=Protein BUDDING UNINHIBITED BY BENZYMIDAZOL 3.2 [Serendipita indica DSM 11827]|nr:Mitotic checkpoint protein BUB3.2 AltName: Full=Protein BUDDING UNINHIBITED BY BENZYMIDAZOL 3.2 [Serendipita indica DSM 11827]